MFYVTHALAEQTGMGSWPTAPDRPRTVYKTRENPPMGPPPGSSGRNQETLNTLPLAKTRKPHLALTCHLLLRPLASILRVGCNRTPFRTSKTWFQTLQRPHPVHVHVPFFVFVFCLKLSSRMCPVAQLLTPSERSYRKRTMGWPDVLHCACGSHLRATRIWDEGHTGRVC